MQTFLPYANFVESAQVLDYKRLGKQRIEALQIAQALNRRNEVNGWRNHPAVKMWEGYPFALLDYGMAICAEWVSRGYKDTMFTKLYDLKWHGAFVHLDTKHLSDHEYIHRHMVDYKPPPWLGDPLFHASHRSNLLRKFPAHYRQFWPDEPDDLPYVWPV